MLPTHTSELNESCQVNKNLYSFVSLKCKLDYQMWMTDNNKHIYTVFSLSSVSYKIRQKYHKVS